ncbi:MAG: hypothetical protein AAFX40_04475, partial [Cyanobacteria bacterium J06639_1]
MKPFLRRVALRWTVAAIAAFLPWQAAASAQEVVDEPEFVEMLTPTTDRFSPDIEILSPRPDETLTSSTVPLRLNVKRLPVERDEATGLGLHVKVIVNNEDPIDYFDISEPLDLDLAPGTHTIRVIGARPWDVSYRRLSSFAHVTFHVEAADGENSPRFANAAALLTVVSPSGTYGAEPILLDYIVDGINLSSAPTGPKVRYTLNDNPSAIVSTRRPVYLEGFQPGRNTLVVELVRGDGAVFGNGGTDYNRV